MISLLSCTCIVAQDILCNLTVNRLCNLAANRESVSINIGICRDDASLAYSFTCISDADWRTGATELPPRPVQISDTAASCRLSLPT